MKIIMGNPPEPGAYHGCAFKHAPDSVLVNLLTQEKLSPDSIREIVTLAKQGSAAAVAAGAGGTCILVSRSPQLLFIPFVDRR